MTAITPRQTQILALVAEGMTDKEIGEELHLSYKTVQTHIASIKYKTSTRTRSQMVAVALRKGYIQ